MAKLLPVKNFDPPQNKLLVHSIEAHNYWINKGYMCPYCTKGSKIVHKKNIEESYK